MPTYEYKCTSCGHQVEVFAKMSDPPPAACEECGAASLEKVLFPVAVHYKGSGFYSTDYGSKRRSGAASEGDGGGSGDTGSGSGSTEGSSTTGSGSSSGSSSSSDSGGGSASGGSGSTGSGSGSASS